MKKAIGTILFVIYSIVAIIVTVLLLSFNDYNCSEIGGYTVFIVNDDSLEPQYKQGSILLIENTNDRNVQVGDEIFLYKVINSQEFEVINRKLARKKQQGSHIVYEVEPNEYDSKNVIEGKVLENENYSNEYFIGKTEDTKVIEGLGTLLSILESKWGYLFCIVVVSLLLFLQEVFDLVIELKYGGGKATKSTKATKTTKAAQAAKTVSKVSAVNAANVANESNAGNVSTKTTKKSTSAPKVNKDTKQE